MKKLFKITLLLLLPFFVSAQNFSDTKTYQKAIDLAQKKQKPILLMITIKPSGEFADRMKPNQAIQDPAVLTKMKTNFVVFEAERADTAMRQIIAKYKVTRFPSFLFLHPNQDIFHIDFGYSSDKMKYLNMMDKALLLSKEKSMSDIAEAYATNKADTSLLKQLINQRKKNGITDNSELIEEYVTHLKISDFNDYQTVLYILEAGPQLDGNAYKFSRTNMVVFNKIYQTESLDKRLAINNAIIDNTYNAAVKTKNRTKATQVANFIRGTWNNDYEKGDKASETRMLAYYSAVRDTTSYFRSATNFYDRYYMRLSADSIKKLDVKNKAEALEKMKKQMAVRTTKMVSKEKMDSIRKTNPNQRVVTTEIVGFGSSVNQYSTELNNIAYRFYQTGTKNINHLTKAMIWSKRAIELDPSWPNYDTLAHIYYAMGIHNEAIATQKIAVDLAKKQNNNGESVVRLSKAYDKMKDKTL